MNLLTWLNDEPQTIILQRDNAFAMLTWRDFNTTPAPVFTPRVALWLFLITAGVPLLMLS